MECIRYINYFSGPHYSLQIDLKDINEDIFKKYLDWMHNKTSTLTISPTYVVNGDRFYIDRYITVEDLIEEGNPHYKAISILGKEIEKLVQHWCGHDEYKDFLRLTNGLDKLIRDADIKGIIE